MSGGLGTVRTPLLNYMPEEMLKTLVFVPVDESGERHLYLATSARFPALKGGSDGVQLGDGDEIALGTTGEVGSGMYSVRTYLLLPRVRLLLVADPDREWFRGSS